MNVLKKHEKEQLITLLRAGLSAREIHRRMGFDRDTVAKYARALGVWSETAASGGPSKPATPDPEVATGSGHGQLENPPPWPPGGGESDRPQDHRPPPLHARSACEPHRAFIEEQVKCGRNAQAIYQDLVDRYAFIHAYNSVKRFVRALRRTDPERFDILEYLPGEEAQVDYGTGAPTRCPKSGKYRAPRLFVMTLKFSRRAFRKVVWNSSQETWSKLHEEAFRYFGGCTQYVVLDNLKEGVIRPDIYEPVLNAVYSAMLDHYGVVADPARVRDPNRKGTVESAIQHTQGTALKGRKFETIEEQNEFLMRWEERWAAPRIHGRTRRQVEEMYQEERPHLKRLPLTSMRYFTQETRTIWGDGCIQVGQSYYGSNPLPVGMQVIVRLYELEIEILHPKTLEVVRRHTRRSRKGQYSLETRDRIFNPSRDTSRLLEQAHKIGPFTEKLCARFFQKQGRLASRSIQGIVALARRFDSARIEEACEWALGRGVQSSRPVRLRLEQPPLAVAALAAASEPEPSALKLVQSHQLIRPASEYADFWEWMTQDPSQKQRRN